MSIENFFLKVVLATDVKLSVSKHMGSCNRPVSKYTILGPEAKGKPRASDVTAAMLVVC